MVARHLLFTWFTLVYFVSGLLINFLQMLVLPLFWLHRNSYHLIITKLCYCLFSEITVLAEWWGEVDVKFYGKKEDLELVRRNNVLCVCNHYSDVDWLAAWVFTERIGVLGRTKVYMKDVVKYVPTMGWAFWFAEFGFLKRNWQEDQSRIKRTMDGIKRQEIPYSITLFCEGTRRTEAKLKTSQDYAKKINMEPLKYHLWPRTKGFVMTVQELQHHVPYILDLEFGFPDIESCTLSHFINRGKLEVHIHARVLPMTSVPRNNNEEISTYCTDIYREKDKLMEYFMEKQEFPGSKINLPRLRFNLVTFIMHNVIVGLLSIVLLNYLFCVFGITVAVVFLMVVVTSTFAVTRLLIRLTQTHKGSSFGLKRDKKK